MRGWLAVVCVGVCLCTTPALPLGSPDVQDPGHYVNSFLVEVARPDVAEHVAATHGFKLIEQIADLDLYRLEHAEVSRRSKRSADHLVNRLKTDPRVRFVEQEITLRRVKRSHRIIHDKQEELPIRAVENNSMFYRVEPDRLDTRGNIDPPLFNDEYYNDQWYLVNTGQTGGQKNMDLNVRTAWENGFTGKGVTVVILDDGIDHDHPDIRRNYDPSVSADLNDEDDEMNDPAPDKSNIINSHGTRCAGEIVAEAGNGICGVGVAYNATIGGIRILDGPVTDSLEAKGLMYQNDRVDIYSASWGPHDDGETMEAPKRACKDALKKGTEKGRNGKGNVFMWAAGNGGSYGDTCAADGYVGSPYSISIGAVGDEGKTTFFTEDCSSTMAVTTSGGAPTQDEEYAGSRGRGKEKIHVVTTDINSGCIENFEGTSSSVPLAAGCVALALEANSELTWRDVQHLIARGSRIPDVGGSWVINGAEFHVSQQFGFGLMDCSKIVELAQGWTNVGPQATCATDVHTVQLDIPHSGCVQVPIPFDGCQGDSGGRITYLEHVESTVHVSSQRRGNIEIFLTSPQHTRSQMLSRRRNDASSEDIDFTFMTVHNWGEDPRGEWLLEVCNNPGTGSTGSSPHTYSTGNTAVLHKFSLMIYGFHHPNPRPSKKSYRPESDTLQELMEFELQASKRIVLKRSEANNQHLGRNKVSPSHTDNKFPVLSQVASVFDTRTGLHDTRTGLHLNHLSRKLNKGRNVGKDSFDSKLGYNTRAFSRGLDTQNIKNDDIEILAREILELLNDMEHARPKTVRRTYLEEYLSRKREVEHQRLVDRLIREVEDILDEK